MHSVTEKFVEQWTTVGDDAEKFFQDHAESIRKEIPEEDDTPALKLVASLVLTDVMLSLIVAARHSEIEREQLVDLVGRAYDAFDIVGYAKSQASETISNLIVV